MFASDTAFSLLCKDNFCQVFGINQISSSKFQYFSEKKLVFKPEPDPNKKVETRKPTQTRQKLVFKPEPDPISGLSRVGSVFFVLGTRCRSLTPPQKNIKTPKINL